MYSSLSNFNSDNIKPKLTENGIKSFLKHILKNCHDFRTNYINIMYNITLLLFFVIILTIILVMKYKGKITPEEQQEKDTKTKNYILSKIKNFQVDKLRKQQSLITGLPHF